MNVIEEIKSRYPLERYIIDRTGFQFKNIGLWKTLPECPFCSGHDCARLNPEGHFHCFQCYAHAFDSIKFRSLYENISYRDALDKFKKEMGITEYSQENIDWVSLRESASDYLRETLFSCLTKYQFKGDEITPIQYLTDIRKHSYDSLLHFRIGFSDGRLVEKLKEEFSKEVIKASGLEVIPKGCFTYPFTVGGEIKYFRIKDPNKVHSFQITKKYRSSNALWFNQDVLKEKAEVWLVEGEDDVISLWDCKINAVGCVGTLTIEQINFLKSIKLGYVYSAFDNDPIKIVNGKPKISAGKKYTKDLTLHYGIENLSIIDIPIDKDIDNLIRESKNKENLIEQLKSNTVMPTPEMGLPIIEKSNGYYIDKTKLGNKYEKQLTNWTIQLEAVIIGDGERFRKARMKYSTGECTVIIPGSVLASVSRFREFLYNSVDRFPYFMGKDDDLSALVQYWEVAFDPKIVKETDCVGEIEEGFISENVFIGNNEEFKPLTNGFLSMDDKHSIKIAELVKRGGSRSEVPYFPLVEPINGAKHFKKNIFSLMVKNRNLKVAIGIGWIKAVLWSKMFYNHGSNRFFPILMLHGKYSGGKTVFAQWLMSMVGLRDCNAEVLSDRGTTEVGLSRKMAFYSSLPVFVDDYRNDDSGQRFHTFFRAVFNRSSPTKGLKADFGVRRVITRGCLLLTGETCPTDPALLSRLISIELTLKERNERNFKELMSMEPQFASVGLSWLRERVSTFPAFMVKYEEIEKLLRKGIDDPRQASVWAVAVAAAITEPVFKQEELVPFAIKLANYEIEERKGEEILGTLWQAVDILDKKGNMNKQLVNHDGYHKEIQIHLAGILGEISGNPSTRKYILPNLREVAKILKQEPYVKEIKNIRVDEKVCKRWVLDIETAPELLRDMFSEHKDEGEDGDDDDI